jgi:hypothetical protein
MPSLSEVRANHVDQLAGALLALLRREVVGSDMRVDVVFDEFAHQSVDRSASARDELKHGGTASFFFERALDRFHLTSNATDAVQELGFLADCVCHVYLRR